MIDLHNHIINQSELTNINWDNTLETARLAIGEGVEHIVWTPELYSINDLQQISEFRNSVDILRTKLNEYGYPLQVSLGADLHMSHIDNVVCEHLKDLVDGDYLVVSFAPYLKPANLHEFLTSILDQELVPVIAHPEQYAWLNEDYDLVYELVELGAWLQVTSDSLLGMFGLQAQHWANRLLDDGLVHLVASESHSLDYKPPLMGEAKQRVDKKLGRKEAENIFHNRAAALLQSGSLATVALPPGVMAHWESKEITA